MRISVFNFVSVAKPQKFEKKNNNNKKQQIMGKTRQAKHIPLRAHINWTASSEFGTYRLCEQPRFRRACASAQSRQNLRCSLIQTVSQEEPSDRKPDPWPLWMAGHAQLKFVMTECSKTQIRLTGLNWRNPRERLNADIRQETPTQVMRKAGVPQRHTSGCTTSSLFNAVTDFTLVRLFIALTVFTETGIKSLSNHLPIPTFTDYVITKLVNRVSSLGKRYCLWPYLP